MVLMKDLKQVIDYKKLIIFILTGLIRMFNEK